MKRLLIVCFSILLITACSAPDRETFLKRKMIGQWNTKSFGGELHFTVTDSTFFVPKGEGPFFADRYYISPLDSITFCTPNDTTTFKLTMNRRADSMWIFSKQLTAEFVRVEE